MKKHFIRWKVLTILCLLPCMFLITCQRDDEPSLQVLKESQSFKITTDRISGDDIPDIMNYLSSFENRRGYYSVMRQNNNRSSEPDLIIGELQTQEILKITDQNNLSNYTFSLTSIESTDRTARSIFNLVVKETSLGLFAFITEYRPDENWIPNYRDPQDFSNFTGDILYYTVEGQFNAKVELNNGQLVVINQRTNCEEDTPGNSGGGGNNTDGNTSDGNTSDGNSDGNNSDGDSSDGNSSSGDDWILVCEQVILVISEDGCDGDPCGISFEHCVVQPQNSPIPPENDLFRNPCLPDNPDVCHQPNGDPCACAPDGGCAEEEPPQDDDNDNDTNPTIGVIFPQQITINRLEEQTSNPIVAQYINEYQAQVNTSPTELGVEFRVVNDALVDFEVPPNDLFFDGTQFPPVQINTLIRLHMHHNTVNSDNQGIQPIFSIEDIFGMASFFTEKQNLGAIDSEDISSILVTRTGLYALVVDDPDKVVEFRNNLSNTIIDDYEKRVIQRVIDLCNGCNEDQEAALFEAFFIRFLNGLDSGLSLYQAFLMPNGEYDTWTLLN